MKALVTGCCGFLGSALVLRLLSEGHKVVGVDNLSDPSMRFISSNLNTALCLYPIDCRDLTSLISLERGIDIVFHFAAHFANERSLREPLECVSINTLGTMAVLEFCRTRGIKRLVYASSSGVYGGQEIVAYSENQPPAPATPYEVSKYAGELLCDGYCKIYGISLVAPRFFNVYGPGDLPGPYRCVVPNFFQLAKHGEPLVVTGGMSSRDFSYIEDAISAVMSGVRRMDEAPGRISLIYNIGTGTEVFIKSLAEQIVSLSGSSSEIIIKEQRHWDNAPRRVADTHKLSALFPEEARNMRSISRGLSDSLQWYLDIT